MAATDGTSSRARPRRPDAVCTRRRSTSPACSSRGSIRAAREGVALNSVSLLRRIAFQADDAQDPLTLARYIGVHLTETRRGADPPSA
ncbi:hypothetical protein [Streptacidiphilus sp. PAMC 29251]